MKLTSMALTKAERKEDSPLAVTGSQENEFPWGLSLTLDNVSLKKLGRKAEDFTPDGYVYLVCKAKCDTIRTTKGGNKEDVSVNLQIESMDLQTGDDKANQAFDKVFVNGK